jgi:hypothetical protein
LKVIFRFFAPKLNNMVSVTDFNITKIDRSKLNDINLENIPFGKYFTDYMLEVDYEDGEWKTPEIKPYQPLLLEPSLAAIHYGQAIFEAHTIILIGLIYLQSACKCHKCLKKFLWKV